MTATDLAPLTIGMHELAVELAALRQEMRGFRESVAELRAQVGDLRDQTANRHAELIELRTQHRVLWAVAGVAGATGLSSLVLGLVQLLRHAAPLWLMVICAALAACGGARLEPDQAQDVADGLAGLSAARSLTADLATGIILAGAAEHVEAVAAGVTLPPPTATPDAIVADPPAYHAAAAAAHHGADERAAQWSVPWWGWVAGAASAALGVVRLLPGPGGAVADLAWTLLAPGAHRQRDRRQQADAEAYRQVSEVIAGLAPHQTVADVRNRLSTAGMAFGGGVPGVPEGRSAG